jgi:ABC-type arginine transport system ATPase subunit
MTGGALKLMGLGGLSQKLLIARALMKKPDNSVLNIDITTAFII